MSDRRRGREAPTMGTDTTRVEMAVVGGASDDTEAHLTGNENVELAYGSNFYLQEEFLQRLQRRGSRVRGALVGCDDGNNENSSVAEHGIGSSGCRASEERGQVELMVNSSLQPLFFSLGNDFPVVGPSVSVAETEEAADAPGPHLGHEPSSEIIIPVVSPTCRMAQSATKGSMALVHLKRQQESERAVREAMDTSKSDLTRLLRKGEAGHQVELLGEEGTQPVVADEFLLDGTDSIREDPRSEADMLRRKVRREQRRLDQSAKSSSSAPTGIADTAAAEATVSEREERERRYMDVQHKREEKLHRVEEAKQRLVEDASNVDEYEARRVALLQMRRQLPIYRCKDELLRCIGENPVSIIVGETGSGKTTQLVQYLYHRGYTHNGKVIGCTQPRRLAAVGVASRVAEEMGCALGTKVGYAIHLDDNTSEDTEVKFMTDGVLLREVVRDKDVSRYSVILLDEAHERSVNTDVLLGVLQAAVRRRSDLKLVVTSATMDIAKFSKFFGHAPCYEIPGQTYEVELRYSPTPVDDYVAEAVYRVCQLHLQMPLEGKHDILVFMTGRDDVLGVCALILRRLKEMDPKWIKSLLIVPCLSEAVGATSTNVLEPAPPGVRKCVVATNVAETSLTIDGIRYVVDCGFMKTNVFRPKLGMNTLQRYPVSQAQANQRKGRAGRTTEGVCYRLYTEAQFMNEMLHSSVPEIQRSSIDSVVLLLKSIGVTRLVDFDFMDPPPAANIRRSMWQLWVLGFLDDGGNITNEGRQALEFPLAPTLAKVLLEGIARDCAVEAVRVVSMISADPKALFELPKDREETARQHHGRFYVNDSDHLTLLTVLSNFIDNGRSRQWAKDHFLHFPTLIRACEVSQQLLERLRQLKLPIASCGPKGLDRVRRCVACGLCLLSARRSNTNWSAYRPMLNAGVTCYIHPSSAVYARGEMPLFVVYHDLLLTTREYLVVVTAVEYDWLVEASRGVFYVAGKMNNTIAMTAQAGLQKRDLAASICTPNAIVQPATFASCTSDHTAVTTPSLSSRQPAAMRSAASMPKPREGMISSRRRNNI
ncbi:Helicase conserved C terminal domain [Trypanosoma vivax]|nr:putative DNAJ domain protein [Trypanosoma vivax]KAH8606234.1 Helicase conserved C terminal domain [Trypanosoma vivax]